MDIRDNRASAIGIASPLPRLLPNPSGTVDANRRGMLSFAYFNWDELTPKLILTANVAIRLIGSAAVKLRQTTATTEVEI